MLCQPGWDGPWCAKACPKKANEYFTSGFKTGKNCGVATCANVPSCGTGVTCTSATTQQCSKCSNGYYLTNGVKDTCTKCPVGYSCDGSTTQTLVGEQPARNTTRVPTMPFLLCSILSLFSRHYTLICVVSVKYMPYLPSERVRTATTPPSPPSLQAALGWWIWEVVPTRRGNCKNAKATATVMHSAQPASNAFSATNRHSKCLDVGQAVMETRGHTTTATTPRHWAIWGALPTRRGRWIYARVTATAMRTA